MPAYFFIKKEFFLLILYPLSLFCSFDQKNNLKDSYDIREESTVVANYFKNFETLSKSEQWEVILREGILALEIAKKSHNYFDEAKICAQLTSTAFYMGSYNEALTYAKRCHELTEQYEDFTLLIRALYLESAVYRALASKEEKEDAQQLFYARAVETCNQAADLYIKKTIQNLPLKGKIYFNLGAAYADNPKGNLKKAESCYIVTLECFKDTHPDDVIRTSIRLGKIYLLENNYADCEQMLNQTRSLISNQRISMHADYLEAQLKLATKDFENAHKIARIGLKKAQDLKAKENESRLEQLLYHIENALHHSD